MGGVVKAVGNVVGSVGGGFAEGALGDSGPNYGQYVDRNQANLQQNVQDQQALARLLAMQAQGQGPNPALAQLQMQSDENQRKAQGMISSQKGINPALAARLGAYTAAQTQQDAAGQAAVMQGNQQLQAQQLQGSIYGNIGNQMTQGQSSLIGGQGAQQAAKSNLVGGLISGGAAVAAQKNFAGGKIEGKAPVPGDHPDNDVVPAMLSPGEIVIPRTKAKDPKLAKEFIDELMKNKKSQSSDEPKGYAKVLKVQRELQEKMQQLEKLMKGA